jgi:hypothetical protein
MNPYSIMKRGNPAIATVLGRGEEHRQHAAAIKGPHKPGVVVVEPFDEPGVLQHPALQVRLDEKADGLLQVDDLLGVLEPDALGALDEALAHHLVELEQDVEGDDVGDDPEHESPGSLAPGGAIGAEESLSSSRLRHVHGARVLGAHEE